MPASLKCNRQHRTTRISANATGIASTADLLARLTADADGNAVLDLGSGNTLTLMGVAPTSLSAADFMLV